MSIELRWIPTEHRFWLKMGDRAMFLTCDELTQFRDMIISSLEDKATKMDVAPTTMTTIDSM